MDSRKPRTAARRARAKQKVTTVSIDLDQLERRYRRGGTLRLTGNSDKKKRTRDDGDG